MNRCGPGCDRQPTDRPTHHTMHHADVLRILPQPHMHLLADAIQTVQVWGPTGGPTTLRHLWGWDTASLGCRKAIECSPPIPAKGKEQPFTSVARVGSGGGDRHRCQQSKYGSCLFRVSSGQDGPLYTAQVSTGPDGLEIPKDSIWWGLAEHGAVHARTRLWNLVGRYVLDDRLKTL